MRENIMDDQLDQVTGGYVVSSGGMYYVVTDDTGKILSAGPVESLARMSAKYQAQSSDVISPEDYAKIFGKPFQG